METTSFVEICLKFGVEHADASTEAFDGDRANLLCLRFGINRQTRGARRQQHAFSSCPGDSDTWLVYPGGVWLYEPSCTELVVITTKTTATLRLQVGPECP
ncbi:MAG: hypothetical protein RLZZ362_2215 [Actinomycetota bacterium]